jgi:hypothetical protein
MVNLNDHIMIHVKSLGLKDKVTLKIGVTPQSTKTLDDISHIKL